MAEAMPGAEALREAIELPQRYRSLWGDAARRFSRNRTAMLGLIVILILATMAALAPVIQRHDPTFQNYGSLRESPNGEFWLGTDLLMLILLLSIFGPSFLMIFFAIGLVSWPTLARLIRGQILSLQQRDFVLAARAMGASRLRIVVTHLLPNTLGPVIVAAVFGIPFAIFAEAALAFIGLGLPPPTPSWGRLVTDGYSAIRSSPHLVLFSTLAIAITMMSFTFIGDGLRDALDPRSR